MVFRFLSPAIFLHFVPLILIKVFRFLFLSLGVIGLLGYLVYFSTADLDVPLVGESLNRFGNALPLDIFYFLVLFFLPIGITIGFFEIFIRFHLMEPPVSESSSIQERLDFYSRRVLYKAKRLPPNDRITIPDITVALMQEPTAAILWARMDINPKEIGKFFQDALDRQESQDPDVASHTALFESIAQLRRENGNDRIYITDILASLFDLDPALQKFILQNDLDKDDMLILGKWYVAHIKEKRKERFWLLENQLQRRPVGLNWTYGYTPNMLRFAENVTDFFSGNRKSVHLIGRASVIEQLQRVLSKTGENNALLVGPDGVGKRTIVYGLAERISHGLSAPALAYKQMFELDVASLLSGSNSDQQLESKILSVLKDCASSGNVILFINDLQTILGLSEGVGSTNLSEVIKPYLASSSIQIIATIDDESYHQITETRQDIANVFETIKVQEVSELSTIGILQEMTPAIEAQENVFLTHQATKAIVEKSSAFMQNKPFPEKAIDLLTEVASHAKTKGDYIIRQEHVNTVVSQKTNVPLDSVEGSEKDKIQNLEALMHESIVNQESAIKQVSQTVLRLRAGITSSKKPAGSFLFTGPTGVGKTLTAKILAKTYFGSEERMIRFDMSEYQNIDSVDRFIGSAKNNQPSLLCNTARDNPFAVMLFDEFEKSHPSIQNLFLQILDEGSITDGFGKKASFKQHIIIATSNAGAEHIRQLVQEKKDPAKQKESIVEYMLEQELFKPELINRFDDVMVFHPLTDDQISQVARMLLQQFAKRLKEKNYDLTITDDLVSYIMNVGYNPQFGARPMQRAIQDTVEVSVANKIVNKEIQKGVLFSVSIEELPEVEK